MQKKYHLEPDMLRRLPEIVKVYQLPSARKATIQILNTFLPFLAMWTAIYLLIDYSIWLALPIAIVNGFFLGRIFIIQHDCGHHSFTPSKQANDTIGMFASLLTCIPYKYWARGHNFHHSHNGVLWEHRDIGDIPMLTVKEFHQMNWWGKFQYMVLRSGFVLFLIVPLVYIFFNNRLPLIQLKGFEMARRALWRSTALTLAFYAALVLLLGWKALIMHLVIVWIFGIIALWFFYIQHQHETAYKEWKDRWDYLRAAIQGSTYYKLPKIMHWLTGNIGYHHIHHLNPLVPNYELARCHRENPVFEKLANTLSFWESLKCVFNKLWDEEQERMITFREYFQKYGNPRLAN